MKETGPLVFGRYRSQHSNRLMMHFTSLNRHRPSTFCISPTDILFGQCSAPRRAQAQARSFCITPVAVMVQETRFANFHQELSPEEIGSRCDSPLPACLCTSKAPGGWRSPRRFALSGVAEIRGSVLECGGPPPLSDGDIPF